MADSVTMKSSSPIERCLPPLTISRILFLLILLLWPTLVSQPAAAQKQPDWRARRITVNRELRDDLNGLILWCRENGARNQEQATLSIYRECGLDRHYLFLPTEKIMPVVRVTGKARDWFDRLKAIRIGHAKRLFELAEKAANAEEGAVAFQLLHEIIYFDRDHAEARKMLGHRRLGDKWKMFPERITVKPGRKQSDFGWARGRWFTATTPHFQIDSNASEEQIEELAQKLEDWHYIWRQVFFEFWKDPAIVKSWFKGKGHLRIPTSSSRRFKVAFFRNHEEYVDYLRKQGVQGGERSSGYYNGQQEYSYFPAVDANGNADESTWRHELAHQLFRESIRTRPGPFDKHFLWLDEGVAMYFESLEIFEGYATVGGFDSRRLQFARMRKKRENFHVPIANLAAMDKQTFQLRRDIELVYSEAAGIVHMLMDSRKLDTRSNLIEFMKLIHRREIKPEAFERLIGRSFEELEEDYEDFLKVRSWDVENRIEKPEIRRQLALSGAKLKDSAFDTLAKCVNLEWVDLAGTTLTTANAQKLSKLDSLEQLFLSRCSMQRGALKTLNQLASLRELDLSGSSVDDQELPDLSQLPKLAILRVTNTNVTDKGIGSLSKIPNLKTLIISENSFSPAAVQKFKSLRSDVTVYER